ncbi:MAG: nuclear transport factor 2 family protein [Bacteroidia bacterium]|nr:nuclear transport factor 2 family protein [Bacteroidia bacterium]
MNNSELITKFYQSFSKGDAEGMVNCYHENIRFEDPAFGVLNGNDAKYMWHLLVERSKGEIKVSFSDVKADDKSGSAQWEAEYNFKQTGRKVLNKIDAQFEFKEGKIIKHTDNFDLWKWSQQAFGWKGYLFGWSEFMKQKIRQKTMGLLKQYIQTHPRV